jgi:Zn-dependent membrane protease YugP
MHAVMLVVLLLAVLLGPQLWVKRELARYHRKAEGNFPGTGGEFARHLLDRFHLQHVKVEPTEMGDHYDPLSKTVRLTNDKYGGRTLTAITVAAHEVGHAFQDAAGEPLFRWRTRLATVAMAAEKFGSFLLFAAPVLALLTRMPAPGLISAIAAFCIMGMGLVVQLLTLPVEWDASFRKALPVLESGYLDPGQKNRRGGSYVPRPGPMSPLRSADC